MGEKQQFTIEFKLDAVKLTLEGYKRFKHPPDETIINIPFNTLQWITIGLLFKSYSLQGCSKYEKP